MSSTRWTFLATVGACAVCALAGCSSFGAPRPALRFGAAEVVVTPEVGTFIIGPMQPSTGLNDDLWARALVLDDGRTRAAIVTIDYVGFDFGYNDVLIESVSRAGGIPPGHVLINCSHNHNAPLTIPWGPWEKSRDRPFHRALPGQLAEVTRRAVAALTPGRVRHLREPVQVGFNRRLPTENGVVMKPNPAGAVVPWTDVLAFDAEDPDAAAVLFVHAAHPVIVHGASTLLSADYPGFAVAALRSRRKGVFLFAQGCGADINGFPLQGGIAAAGKAGRDLAGAVERAWDRREGGIGAVDLRVASSEVELALEAPPAPEEIRARMAAEPDPGACERLAELLQISQTSERRTLRFRVRGLALGRELCLLGGSHELFAEYQLFADAASPFAHTVMMGYTNGVESYVGTEKDYRLGERGGYETSPFGAPLIYWNRTRPTGEVERTVRGAIETVLRALYRG